MQGHVPVHEGFAMAEGRRFGNGRDGNSWWKKNLVNLTKDTSMKPHGLYFHTQYQLESVA